MFYKNNSGAMFSRQHPGPVLRHRHTYRTGQERGHTSLVADNDAAGSSRGRIQCSGSARIIPRAGGCIVRRASSMHTRVATATRRRFHASARLARGLEIAIRLPPLTLPLLRSR